MKMKTQTENQIDDQNGNKSKPLLPAVFYFAGWSDENCENPKKDGIYLCLCKWSNIEQYQYHILEFSQKDKLEVTDSCEHILWANLPPNPFR